MLQETEYTTEENIKMWIENWDFSKSKTNTYTHRLHTYPAIFIPQLVRKLILQYTNEEEVVLDIFNGSGTTSVESTLLNRQCIGIELNPLANLIAKVKTTLYSENELVNCFKDIETFYWKTDLEFEIKSFPNIEFWYSTSAITHLSKLSQAISKVENKEICDFFKVAFSKILREISVCKHSGFKMHRDLKKLERDITDEFVWNYFKKSALENIKSSAIYTEFFNTNQKPDCLLLQGSSIEHHSEIKKGSVDLILTSPPYGDSKTTVAYGQFSRLSSQWLDLSLEDLESHDISNLDNELLGGKTLNIDLDNEIINSITLQGVITQFKYLIDTETDGKTQNKLRKRLKDVLSFFIDLNKVLIQSENYLKSGGYFVLITGSRIVKGIKIHLDQIIAELVEENGIELKAIMYRNIPNKRMPSVVSATNAIGDRAKTMTRESVIVLKKQ